MTTKKEKGSRSYRAVGLTAQKNPRILENNSKNGQINILIYIQMKIKGTIHGLGFVDGKQSVNKIKNSGKTHAHKMQLPLQCRREG